MGLTDQWVHQRLSNQHYQSWYKQLADTVAAADANFAAQQQQQNQQRHGRGSERLSEGGSGKQPVSTPRLVAEKDYRWAPAHHSRGRVSFWVALPDWVSTREHPLHVLNPRGRSPHAA